MSLLAIPTLSVVLAYLATGLAAGFIGGFLGVGGGILYVPVLDFVFRRFGIADGTAFHLALGTSLATITATSAVSAYTHHGAQQVNWRAVGIMAIGGLVGVTISAQAAIGLDPRVLKALFGLLLFGVAYRFFAHAPRPVDTPEQNSVPRLLIVGLASSFIAGFFGVGGGIVTVPLLCMVCHYRTHRAIGTSAALIVFNSLVGMINYGSSTSTEPIPGAVGFVHISAWIFLATASMLTSRVGALTAHRLNPKPLRTAFAVFIVILGVRYVVGYFFA